jgi:hypothetical protein
LYHQKEITKQKINNKLNNLKKITHMNLKNLLFASVIVLSANASFAQDTNKDSHTVSIKIAEVALLDLEVEKGTTAITLEGTAPTEAGMPMTFEDANNSDIWINYSSIVGSTTEPGRNVSVLITDGVVPSGLKLTVVAAEDAKAGAGKIGLPSDILILSDVTPQDIISGVGSAYTGDGANKGHKLTYQLAYLTNAAADYSKLDFDDTDVLTITYTLSDI